MSTLSIPSKIAQRLLEPYQGRAAQRVHGGLSGAQVWHVTAAFGRLCLRAWPKSFQDVDRLQTIHHGLERLRMAGISFVPRLLVDRDGMTYCQADGRLWELATWMEGVADYQQHPSRERLRQAVLALARIHNAWANEIDIGVPTSTAPSADLPLKSKTCTGASPTAADRLCRLDEWMQRLSDPASLVQTARLASQIDLSGPAELTLRTQELLLQRGPRLREALVRLCDAPVPLQYVMRDIHSEHVLFTDKEVTGIIDFGAMRIDEPTTDLVRLLGSLEPHDRAARRQALRAYASMAPSIDLNRFAVLDEAATLLSAAQWMQWLVIEQQTFEQPIEVSIQRWRRFVTRFEDDFKLNTE